MYRQIRRVATDQDVPVPLPTSLWERQNKYPSATRRTKENRTTSRVEILDGVLTVWPGPMDELKDFQTHLNSRISTIKFTLDASEMVVNYLDLTLYKGDRFAESGHLDIRPYAKPTASFEFLHYTSCHSN